MYIHEPAFYVCSYDLMMKCWNKSPAERPRFSRLVSEISTSLEGMADYTELMISTEPLSKDLTVTTEEECMAEESDVKHVLQHETKETECRIKNEYI